MKLIAWLGNVLSADNSASFGRFASLLCLVACLSWDSCYLFFVMRHYGQFHFVASDLLAYGGLLMGQGAFCTMPYGASKGLDVLKSATGKEEPKG